MDLFTLAAAKSMSGGSGGSGGGSDLPSVTNDDNGKILQVKNGAWSVENNDGRVLYILINPTTGRFFYTFNQLRDEAMSGVRLFGVDDVLDKHGSFPLLLSENGTNIQGQQLYVTMIDDEPILHVLYYSLDSGDTAFTVEENTYSLTPAV